MVPQRPATVGNVSITRFSQCSTLPLYTSPTSPASFYLLLQQNQYTLIYQLPLSPFTPHLKWKSIHNASDNSPLTSLLKVKSTHITSNVSPPPHLLLLSTPKKKQHIWPQMSPPISYYSPFQRKSNTQYLKWLPLSPITLHSKEKATHITSNVSPYLLLLSTPKKKQHTLPHLTHSISPYSSFPSPTPMKNQYIFSQLSEIKFTTVSVQVTAVAQWYKFLLATGVGGGVGEGN